jgi:hypothetical protein
VPNIENAGAGNLDSRSMAAGSFVSWTYELGDSLRKDTCDG